MKKATHRVRGRIFELWISAIYRTIAHTARIRNVRLEAVHVRTCAVRSWGSPSTRKGLFRALHALSLPPLSGYSGHGRTCCGLDPVANDPGRVKTQSVLWFPLLNRGGMMKGFVQGADRQQTTLLPECLDDWVGESNPVRAVDVFVDALELRDLGFDGVDPAATGRPGYHPSPMLKLYIYGYLNRVQS